MEFLPTALKDVLLVRPRLYSDDRGYFAETYRQNLFLEAGIKKDFVQVNVSGSVKGTLRGLHYQIVQPQAKLVMVTRGEILDVAVDLRRHSPDFGRHVCVELSEYNLNMLYIPEGFAHGFQVVSDHATFVYKCSDYYHPEGERGIRWNDPELGIQWPLHEPILSEKDSSLPLLSALSITELPG